MTGTRLWLWRRLGFIPVLALLTLSTVLTAASGTRDAAQTIGRDAEPSVALGLRLASLLADLDAAAFDDALTDPLSSGTSARFRAARAEINRDQIEAARNITYGEAEAGPLRQLGDMLTLYDESLTQSRNSGQNLWLTAQRLRWASRVLRDRAVPAALQLAKANAAELERRYAAYRAGALIWGGAGLAGFLLLMLVLVEIQIGLIRRVRRLINPFLAAATLLTLAGGLWFGHAIWAERRDLGIAKADAYDSLYVLFQAKSAVDALDADMALWLFDPQARPALQNTITTGFHRLISADLTRPAEAQGLRAGLAQAQGLEQAGQSAEALALTRHQGGLLGAELDNITFGPAERDAASRSVTGLIGLESLIDSVQRRAVSGQQSEAIGLWLDPDKGGRRFPAEQAALDQTLAVNQAEFDRHVSLALDRAGWIGPLGSLAAGIAALLAMAGLWQRLQEYR